MMSETVDERIQREVIEALGHDPRGWDIPAIARVIRTQYGGDVDSVGSERLWQIASEHRRRK